jgi:uncharacterized protein (TIGR03790 family)
MRHIFAIVFALIVSMAALVSPAYALEPDQILLLVNKNIPESGRLAEFYASVRQIPKGRILSLPLPVGEEIAFAGYERDVVPAVREFIRKNGLEDKITCVVSFYGVPLRIGSRLNNPQNQDETRTLQAEREKALAQLREIVTATEATLHEFDPKFKPGEGDTLEHLAPRADTLMRPLAQRAMAAKDPKQHAERQNDFVKVLRALGGPALISRTLAHGEARATDEDRAKYAGLAEQVRKTAAEIAQVQENRADPASRARMRQLVADGFGLIDLLRVIQAQQDYLNPANSVAAFDSELALLWWNFYPRSSWQANLLHYGNHGVPSSVPRTLMVMRLDAPQAGEVRDIILASIRAERDGLKGRIVLDSRGIAAQGENARVGSYGWYDQSLRNLADIVRTKTKLQLLHDDSPAVLPPGSAADVALYCGWYSLRNYVPACRFNKGAVGFHVASLELVSLKSETETGWCSGLLNDGIAATLGPVAEPYLAAFPPADEFFPLLMTGKLTLAEVYWKTAPVTSWMISMIGDPLYKPYAVNPPLKVDDLPDRLKVIFKPPTPPTTQPTAPATAPGK